MRNITAAPDDVLAYHKLLPRFTVDMCNKINRLDHFSTQEFDTYADLLLSECADYSWCGRALIPLVDAGLSYAGKTFADNEMFIGGLGGC
jgi:hypothetical protein